MASMPMTGQAFFVLTAINGLPTWYRRRGPDSAERIAESYAGLIVATVVGGPR